MALSFVLGLQYMVAPGTQEMQYADFRSLLCKSQEPADAWGWVDSVQETGNVAVGITMINHPPVITIDNWYKSINHSEMGGL